MPPWYTENLPNKHFIEVPKAFREHPKNIVRCLATHAHIMGMKVLMDQQTEKRKLDKEAEGGGKQKKVKANVEGAVGGSASNKKAKDSKITL